MYSNIVSVCNDAFVGDAWCITWCTQNMRNNKLFYRHRAYSFLFYSKHYIKMFPLRSQWQESILFFPRVRFRHSSLWLIIHLMYDICQEKNIFYSPFALFVINGTFLSHTIATTKNFLLRAPSTLLTFSSWPAFSTIFLNCQRYKL